MPRLSEPMREALRAAERSGGLTSVFGLWRPINGIATIAQSTINALTLRGLLQHVGQDRVITPAGREAIGMKEGEDNG